MPGPHLNICTFCSLGCDVRLEPAAHADLVRQEYVAGGRFGGRLCAKGNYIADLVNHPGRLDEPRIEGDRTPLGEVLARVGEAMREREKVALVLSGDASVEEGTLAARFSADALAPERFAVAFPTGDGKVARALAACGAPAASPDDLAEADCVVAVGRPFEVGPVAAGAVLNARHSERGCVLASIAEGDTLFGRFADERLGGTVRHGLVELVGALGARKGPPDWARDIAKAAKKAKTEADPKCARRIAAALKGADRPVFLLATGDPLAAGLASAACVLAGKGASLLALSSYPNARELAELSTASVPDVIKAAREGRVTSLICLGVDLIEGYPHAGVAEALGRLEMLVVGAAFESEFTRRANVVLPVALAVERDGTFLGHRHEAAARPPGGAAGYGEILKTIAAAMGVTLGPAENEPGTTGGEATVEPFGDAAGLIEEALSAEPPAVVMSTAVDHAERSLTRMVRLGAELVRYAEIG